MAPILDLATEQRIQRELARGVYSAPADLIAHALDLVEAERQADDWLLRNRNAVNAMIEESFAQKARGEFTSPEEAHRILADRRASRAA